MTIVKCDSCGYAIHTSNNAVIKISSKIYRDWFFSNNDEGFRDFYNVDLNLCIPCATRVIDKIKKAV